MLMTTPKSDSIERVVYFEDLVASKKISTELANKVLEHLDKYEYSGTVEHTKYVPASGYSPDEPVESEWVDAKDCSVKFMCFVSQTRKFLPSEVVLLADAFVEAEYMWYASSDLDEALNKIHDDDEAARGDAEYHAMKDRQLDEECDL